jgi:hypothetical protein
LYVSVTANLLGNQIPLFSGIEKTSGIAEKEK